MTTGQTLIIAFTVLIITEIWPALFARVNMRYSVLTVKVLLLSRTVLVLVILLCVLKLLLKA